MCLKGVCLKGVCFERGVCLKGVFKGGVFKGGVFKGGHPPDPPFEGHSTQSHSNGGFKGVSPFFGICGVRTHALM